MFKRNFYKMAVAQIAASLIVVLCLLIDSIMIGKFLGLRYMAAYGLANPVLLTFAGIGTMIATGAQVVCSQSIGSGNNRETDANYTTTIIMCIIVGLVGICVIGFFGGPISELLGADRADNPILYTLTRDYLWGFIIGIPAFVAATVLVPFLQLAGKQTTLVFAVGMMIVSDIIFDLMNVFVFKGGMFGMGLASSMSYIVACVIGLSFFVSKKCMFKFRFSLVDIRHLRRILKAGSIAIINMASMVLLTLVFNRILLTLSMPEASLAAYSIIMTASNICYAFSSGFGSVALTLSGIYYHENDKNTLKYLLKLTLKSILIIDIIVAVIILICAPWVIDLFVKDGNERARILAIYGLRLFVISLIPCGVTAALKNFYQGTMHIRLTAVISFLQNFLCIASVGFILSRFIDTTGVWLGYLGGETLALCIISLYVFYKRKSMVFSTDNFALLSDNFGVADDHCLKKIVSSVEEVIRLSEQAYEFCKTNGASKLCCSRVALCIEELGKNVFEHGYAGGKGTLDISLFYVQSEIILRLRDEGKIFNPVNYFETHGQDKTSEHMGIRLVQNVVKSINYTNSMSQNSLTLTLDLI